MVPHAYNILCNVHMLFIIHMETGVSLLICSSRKVWTGFRQYDQNIEVQMRFSSTAALTGYPWSGDRRSSQGTVAGMWQSGMRPNVLKLLHFRRVDMHWCWDTKTWVYPEELTCVIAGWRASRCCWCVLPFRLVVKIAIMSEYITLHSCFILFFLPYSVSCPWWMWSFYNQTTLTICCCVV